jgi:hypothetical protein
MPIPREARPLLPIRGESQAFQCEAAKNNAGVRRGRLRLPLVTLAPWGRKPPESGSLPISGATYDIVIENGTLTPGNRCDCLVEAVGIEPASDPLVSHDSVAITQAHTDHETCLNPSESGLEDQLGTRVPNVDSIDFLSERLRQAWGVLRVI